MSGQPAVPAGAAGPAGEVISLLGGRGWSVAVAESLTGGLLGATLTAVPGASAVFRGGVIAYATEVKAALLGVPPGLLAARGAVDPDVALAMADGVRDRLGATVGVATTGVAGPDPADGKPVGTVHIAVTGAGRREQRGLALAGDRERIRAGTVLACLRLLRVVLGEESS